MNREEKQHVADTLVEKPFTVKVGFWRFKVKQPTLGQIYEMGAVANDIDEKDIQEKVEQNAKINVLAEAISHYKDARLMQEIFLILVFRSRFKRKLWRKYILKRLTVSIFNQVTKAVGGSLNINFFLTSIIFLKQTTRITEPTQTTALGQSSEE